MMVSAAEKIESLAGLIAGRMEILLLQASTVMYDVEIVVQEMELIVTMVALRRIDQALAARREERFAT